jgi:CHAD domain-containing protein
MIATDRTAIGRRLAVARKPHRPPLRGWRPSRHAVIVARPLRTTLAATIFIGVSVGLAALARVERGRRAARSQLPRRNRHFGLLGGESAAEGLKRITLGQLDIAIEQLHRASGEPARAEPGPASGATAPTAHGSAGANGSAASADEAVHETRKALKRLRALLVLLEGALEPQLLARERVVLRDAGARLAGARDAEVMVATLDALMRRHPRRLGRRRGLLDLRAHLERERVAAAVRAFGGGVAQAGQSSNGSASEHRQVMRELSALRARVRKWDLPAGELDGVVNAGLERIYREGRADFRRAAGRRPGGRALHRWRKDVKELRYAAEVLDVKDGLGARAQASGDQRLTRLARRTDALGEQLGEEHDLALLADLARAHKPLKQRKRARRALLRTISRRRARLRERALAVGARVYARKSRRFVRRARACYGDAMRP